MKISCLYPYFAGLDPTAIRNKKWNAREMRICVGVDEIFREAAQFDVEAWLHKRRAEAEEYEFSEDDTLAEWPGEIAEKGEISLHRDILTSEVGPEVYLSSAKIA